MGSVVLEPRFDAEAVRELVASCPTDISIGGSTLAAEAFRAGLIDEVELFLVPTSVGGGTPALPAGLVLRLDLIQQRAFSNGTVYLRHAVSRTAA